MIVPLGIKAYNRSLTRQTELVNMFLEKDETGLSPDGIVRVKRPGMVVTSQVGAGIIRGLDYRVATGQQVYVSGPQLYVGGVLATGTIPDYAGKVRMVETFFSYFVLSGNALQYLDSTNTLQPIVMPNDAPPVIDIDQVENYLLILTQTGRFYWLEPGSVTVDPLNFATAESSADAGVAICRLGDEFLIFGTETTEIWQTTGDQDAPFQRAVGRNYERGCVSRDTVCHFDNGLMWVADGNTVCRVGNVPQIISDDSISEHIQRATFPISAFTFLFIGHEFYVVNIPGEGSYAYDASTQTWCRFRTGDGRGWRPRVGYTRNTETYLGDTTSNTIWRIDQDATTDAGTAIITTASGIVAFVGAAQRNDSVSFAAEVSATTTFGLAWRDGQDDYNDPEDVEVRAPFDVGTLYRLGQPDQPYRQIRITNNEPVGIRLIGCRANEGWK